MDNAEIIEVKQADVLQALNRAEIDILSYNAAAVHISRNAAEAVSVSFNRNCINTAVC